MDLLSGGGGRPCSNEWMIYAIINRDIGKASPSSFTTLYSIHGQCQDVIYCKLILYTML